MDLGQLSSWPFSFVIFRAISIKASWYRDGSTLFLELRHMNPTTKYVTTLALLAAASLTNAGETPAPIDEKQLIGAWQEGMSSRLDTSEKRQMAKKAGLLGAITVYKADHQFELYPRCGKQDGLTKAGFKSIQGTWQLTNSGELLMAIAMAGNEIKHQVKVQIQNGQLIGTDEKGRASLKAGKYEGPLPPEC
jgi:hypothetical protein